jgi:hypothetical protein
MNQRIQNPIVTLSNVRLSYPALFTPRPLTPEERAAGKKPKFEATAILDAKANAKELKAMQDAIAIVKKHPKLGGKAPRKVCLRKGDDTEERAAAEELGPTKWTVGARNARRPGVVDQKLQPLVEEDGKPYGGCYVNMRVEVYPYVHPQSGPGIGASLINVQFVCDGEPFGAKGGPAEEGFTEIEEEESPV